MSIATCIESFLGKALIAVAGVITLASISRADNTPTAFTDVTSRDIQLLSDTNAILKMSDLPQFQIFLEERKQTQFTSVEQLQAAISRVDLIDYQKLNRGTSDEEDPSPNCAC